MCEEAHVSYTYTIWCFDSFHFQTENINVNSMSRKLPFSMQFHFKYQINIHEKENWHLHCILQHSIAHFSIFIIHCSNVGSDFFWWDGFSSDLVIFLLNPWILICSVEYNDLWYRKRWQNQKYPCILFLFSGLLCTRLIIFRQTSSDSVNFVTFPDS